MVSLRFLQNYNIYDKELYENFVRDVEEVMKPTSKEEQRENLKTIVEAQDPITNEKLSRFFELLAVLDFHKKHETT